MDVKEVAKAFISKVSIRAIEDDEGITPLKLQKLLFLAQEEHLFRTGHQLFENKIEAWEHGPVVREIWNSYNGSNQSIKNAYEEVNLDNDSDQTIQKIWSEYGKFDGWYLRGLTHTYRVWNENYDPKDEYSCNEITPESIKKYREEIESGKREAVVEIERLMAGI